MKKVYDEDKTMKPIKTIKDLKAFLSKFDENKTIKQTIFCECYTGDIGDIEKDDDGNLYIIA